MSTIVKITWSKKEGYECSSAGDMRFSAFGAIMPDGRTLEQHYQCDVKGYEPGGTNWKLGKGKPPLDKSTKPFPAYLNLWKIWANLPGNIELLEELYLLALKNGNRLSDKFATGPVNQAHALSVIINDLKKEVKTKITATIYTDGSANPNPGPAGYGFAATDSTGKKYLGHGPTALHSTNNASELLGVAYGILQLRNNIPTLSNINLFSDSKYVLNNLKYFDNWKANGFLKSDGQPVANKEVWEYLDSVLTSVKSSGVTIKMDWVKGHDGNEGNELADKQADLGRLVALENKVDLKFGLTELHNLTVIPFIKLTPTDKVAEAVNPLMCAKRWFFITGSPDHIQDRPYYFGANYEDKKDENNRNLGKRTPDTMYTMLKPKERIKPLDDLRAEFEYKYNDGAYPIICDLKKITTSKVWTDLSAGVRENVEFLGDLLVTKSIAGSESVSLGNLHFPPKLAFRVPNEITRANDYITDYETHAHQNLSPQECSILFFDITDKIYSSDAKGKVSMQKEFTVSEKYIDIALSIPYYEKGEVRLPVTDDVIRLTANLSMPGRTCFSSLIKVSKEKPKVTLIVYDSCERSCRVAVIVEFNGDIACYFASDSDFIIKR